MKTALAVTLALAAAPSARAGVVDTFSFTDAGFSGAISPGQPGLLSGTFTGAVEADGSIRKADLSSFRITYATGGTQLFGYGPAAFFSFLPGSDSTLDFSAPIGVAGSACVGAVAAFGAFGCGAGGVNGEVAGLDVTQALPVLTLVSSIVVIPPQPPPIPTPTPFPVTPMPTPMPPVVPPAAVAEPAGWTAPAAGALALAALRRRRRYAPNWTSCSRR